MNSPAQRLLQLLPGQGEALKRLGHAADTQAQVWWSRAACALSGTPVPAPGTVFSVAPVIIGGYTCVPDASADWEDWVYQPRDRVRRVQPGDWDQGPHAAAEMRICRAVEARVAQGTPWSETEYHAQTLRKLNAGALLWGCRSRADLDRHCEGVDRLIEAIARNGYLPAQATPSRSRPDTRYGQREILVNVARDGRLLFQDGRHRYAIARALRTPAIPVQVLVWHRQWVQGRADPVPPGARLSA